MQPDDYKSSPTGRIPKWVVDEAHGRPVDAVPFRNHTAPSGRRGPGGSRGSWRGWLTAVVVLGLLGGLSYVTRGSSTSTTITLGSAKASGPAPGREESDRPLGAPPVGTPSTSYRFSRHQTGSQEPVTWSPCRPVHYVVRPEHSPAEGPQLIANAVALVQQATGLRFVDDGTTREGPSEERALYQPERYGERWAPVLITWATADEVPDFGVDIAGEAGPAALTTPSGDSTFVSGAVALDAVQLTDLLRRGDTATPQAVVLHELGHLAGLSHVNDAAQLMFPRTGAMTTFGSGDLAGLARLGSGPCQPDI